MSQAFVTQDTYTLSGEASQGTTYLDQTSEQHLLVKEQHFVEM